MYEIGVHISKASTRTNTHKYESLKGLEELFEHEQYDGPDKDNKHNKGKERFGLVRFDSSTGGRDKSDVKGLKSNLLFLDIDNSSAACEEYHKALKEEGINHIIYSTYGHGEGEVKLRIVIESGEYSQDNKNITIKKQNQEICRILRKRGLDFKLDPASDRFTQLMYFRMCKDKDKAEIWTHYEGDIWDIISVDLEEKESLASSGSNGTEEEWYEDIKIGKTFHNALLMIANGMLADEMKPDAVKRHLRRLMHDSNSAGSDHWQERYNEIDDIVDNWTPYVDDDIVEQIIIEEEEVEELPDIPWPKGLMGELAQSAYDSMYVQHRSLAVMIALGEGSVIAGRGFNHVNYPGYSHLGLNVYLLAAGDSGVGKSAIEKHVKWVFHNMADNSSGRIGNGTDTGPKALMDSLEKSICQISCNSEAGLSRRVKSGDPDGLQKAWLDLYTNSSYKDRTVGRGGSNEDATILPVVAPHYVIFGESTRKTIFEALNDMDAMENGLMGRYTSFLLDRGGKNHDKLNLKTRFSAGELLERRVNELLGGYEGDPFAEPTDVVEITYKDDQMQKEAESIAEDWHKRKRSDTAEGIIAGRMYTKLAKHASIHTIINGNYEVEINEECVNDKLIRIDWESWEWAKKMMEYERVVTNIFIGQMEKAPSGGQEAMIEGRKLIRDILDGTCKNKKAKRIPLAMIEKKHIIKNVYIDILGSKKAVGKLNSKDNASQIKSGAEKVLSALLQGGEIKLEKVRNPLTNHRVDCITVLRAINRA